MRKLSLFSIAFAALFLSPYSVRAEPVSGLIITPAALHPAIANGSGQTHLSFEVGNYTATVQQLHLRLSDFVAGGDNNNAAQLSLNNPNPNNRYGLIAWASLDQNVLTLQPSQTKLVTIRINDDTSLLPGGHYGALIVTTDSPQAGQNIQKVVLNQALSGLIFLTKTGGEAYGLLLTDVKSTETLIGETANLSLRFQNTGNVHVVPRGIAQVYDPRGRLVSQGVVNTDSDILLPETNKIETAQLHSLSQANWPGRYMLVIRYHREGDDNPVTSSISFLYIPPLQVVVAIMSLFLIAAGLLRRQVPRRKSTPRALVVHRKKIG